MDENTPHLSTDNGSDMDGFSVTVDEGASNFSIDNGGGRDSCSIVIGSDILELEEGASIDWVDKLSRVAEDGDLSELSTDNGNDKDGCNFSIDLVRMVESEDTGLG